MITLTPPAELELENEVFISLKYAMGPLENLYGGGETLTALARVPLQWTGTTDQPNGSAVEVLINDVVRIPLSQGITVADGAFSFWLKLEEFGDALSDGSHRWPNNRILIRINNDAKLYVVAAMTSMLPTAILAYQGKRLKDATLQAAANGHLYDIEGRDEATYREFYWHWGYPLGLVKDPSQTVDQYKEFIRAVYYYLNNLTDWAHYEKGDPITGFGCHDAIQVPLYTLLGEYPQVYRWWDMWLSGMGHYLPLEVVSPPSLTVAWTQDFSRYYNRLGVRTLLAGNYTVDPSFEGYLYLDGTQSADGYLEVQASAELPTGVPFLDYWRIAYITADASHITDISQNGVLGVDSYGETLESAMKTLVIQFQDDYSDSLKILAWQTARILAPAYGQILMQYSDSWYEPGD